MKSSLKLVGLTVVALLLVLVPATSGVAHAATLCVNPGGTHGCFASIQAAVNAAGLGDTITVAPGTYHERVIVDKAGLKLTAQGAPGKIKLMPPSSLPQCPAGGQTNACSFGFTLVANNVTILGFEITGFNGYPDASGIFVGGLFAGDTAHRADGATIRLNLIHDNGNGVYLWQSNNNKIEFNTIFHSIDFDGAEGTGILSFNGYDNASTAAANAAGHSGKHNTISHNAVFNNDRLAIFAGACSYPYCDLSTPQVNANISGTTIDHNVAYGNGADKPLGGQNATETIGLLNAHGGTISHNDVHNNPNLGILINYSDGATIDHNTATHTGAYGIELNFAYNVEVAHNTTDGNRYFGILVLSSDKDSLTDNSAHDNVRFDLYWDGAGSVKFDGNHCGTAYPSKAKWDCEGPAY